MELRGIRGLWLATSRRFRGISPDSADEAPKRRTKPPKDGGQVPAYALHPGYAGSVLLALVVGQCERAVGCGERSEPHQPRLCHLMRFAALTTSYMGWIPAFAGMTVSSCSHGKSSNNRQAGAALITSLIFLTVLTILGMSTLGTALLESRMAGNARDRNLAFQAAEIGLRDAELFIRDSGRIVGNIVQETGTVFVSGLETTCGFGFCHNGNAWGTGTGNNWITAPVWESPTFWATAIQYQRAGATGKPVGLGSTQLAIDPLHVPLYVLPAGLPLVTRQPEYLIESFSPKPLDAHYYYRITVRGYGMRPGTRVMLQEIYTPN